MIKNYYLNSDDKKIFCTYFEGSNTAKTCILIFLPLFEERMWSQRIAYNYAILSAESGIPVIMWDYYGYGESDGDTEEFTYKICREDCHAIIEHLKSEYKFEELYFLGIRTGCGIIGHILKQGIQNVSRIVFWAPVTDTKNFLFTSLRSTISTQSYVFKKIVANRDTILNELLISGECSRGGYKLNHIDGYRLGKSFYEEIMASGNMDLTGINNIQVKYFDIIPPGKEALMMKIKETREKELIDRLNISYSIIIDKEFWINNLDYSQQSEKLYTATREWFKK